MEPSPSDLALLNHFTVFVYPFLHDLSARNRPARLEALEARWAPWWSRLDDRELATALEDTSFFLPYIRHTLYPETGRLQREPPGEKYARWAGRIRDWAADGLAAFAHELPHSCILRLTCRPELLAGLSEFTVVDRRESRGVVIEHTEIPARLDWIDAVLFGSGVGFLLLKVRLGRQQPRLAELIRLNSCLRLVHPPTLYWKLPTLHFPGGDRPLQVRDLVNFLTQGMAGDAPAGPADPFALPTDDADRVPYTETEPGQAYGERCQLLSYACIHLADEQRRELPAGAFDTPEDRVLFELAACIGLGESVHNPTWVPSEDQARRFLRDNRLALWRCWRAMALKESLVFLATEDLPFNRRGLPHAIDSDYLPLYVYTLYQKFQLFLFANDLMRAVAEACWRLSGLGGLRALLQRFVAFRNRFWFNEVTRKPQGGELYRKLQQGLEVHGLYDMVTSSVKEAKGYHEERRDRQVRLLLNAATLLGPAAMVVGALRMLFGWDFPLPVKLLLLAGIGTGLAAVLLYLHLANSPARGHVPRRRRRRRKLTPVPLRLYAEPTEEAETPDWAKSA